MGFTGHSAIHFTVGFHRLFTVKPTFTFKDQSSKHMGLSNYTQSSHLTVGFITFFSQTLLIRSKSTRHIQANIWVYQATNQAILPVEFIRPLRQWERRTAKIVSSSIELITPSQNLYGLASPLYTHPTQGSVPFSSL